MEIVLCGYKVLIDEEDYEKISKHKWHVDYKLSESRGYTYFVGDSKRKDGRKTTVRMHRIIKDCFDKDMVVDHISGDTLDNRKCNLRICTHIQNMQNQKIRADNTTGYKGVTKRPENGTFRARITVNKKSIYLGKFIDPEQAYAAYCEASKKYHGEYGSLG